MASPHPLSACIIAMNEEDRIGACLDSLDFCDEIVVVDSHSTDATREIAAERGARVIERDWPGHVAQKGFAVTSATHDWVLCLDADERVSETLRAELLALQARGFEGHAGWSMPRLSWYLGRPIRHGSWYPDRCLRLFDRRRGRWAGVDPHDHVALEGASEAGGGEGRLRGDIEHQPYRTFGEHLATIDRYTTTMAEGLFARGKRAGVLDLVTRPTLRFVRFYFLKLGLLEGWRGLLLAYLAAHYGRLKYAKLLVLQRCGSGEDEAGAPGESGS